MEFVIKKIEREDWDDLLIWRNDELTRKMSINNEIIEKDKHHFYMSEMSQNYNREQFIFLHYKNKIGTIRIDKLNDGFEQLSYTINPLHRAKGYGGLMMRLFLFDKVGKYRCEIKSENIESIKMLEKNRFEHKKTHEGILVYEIVK